VSSVFIKKMKNSGGFVASVAEWGIQARLRGIAAAAAVAAGFAARAAGQSK
jgi:hypothetical protein